MKFLNCTHFLLACFIAGGQVSADLLRSSDRTRELAKPEETGKPEETLSNGYPPVLPDAALMDRNVPEPIINNDLPMPEDLQEAAALASVDFSLPVPEGVEGVVPGHRSLQSTTTSTWYCYTDGRYVDSVRIWWGHTYDDGKWACNEWVAACNGNCGADKVENSMWNCYSASNLKFFGNVQIWWGHGVDDGKWACDNWVEGCKSSGGCLVTGGAVFDGKSSCNTWETSDGCSGGLDWEKNALKQACDQHDYCYHGPIVTSFRESYHWCSNLFIEEARALNSGATGSAEIWYGGMRADWLWNHDEVGGPGFGDAYQTEQIKTEKRCLLGRSEPSGYGSTPCWGSNTRCAAGTSCYNCCGGSRWVWEWFGDHCW